MTESQRKPTESLILFEISGFFFFLICEERQSVFSEHSSLHLTQMMFLALDTMDVETWIILEACLYTGCKIKKKRKETASRKGGEQCSLWGEKGTEFGKHWKENCRGQSQGSDNRVCLHWISQRAMSAQGKVVSVTHLWGRWQWLCGRLTFRGEWS